MSLKSACCQFRNQFVTSVIVALYVAMGSSASIFTRPTDRVRSSHSNCSTECNDCHMLERTHFPGWRSLLSLYLTQAMCDLARVPRVALLEKSKGPQSLICPYESREVEQKIGHCLFDQTNSRCFITYVPLYSHNAGVELQEEGTLYIMQE